MFSNRTAWDVSPTRLTQARRHHSGCGRTALDLSCASPSALGLRYTPEFFQEVFEPQMVTFDDPTVDAMGLEEAREAVARLYYARRGLGTRAENVCLNSTVAEAYTNLLTLLCDPGDLILVPEPSHPALAHLAELARVELVPYALTYEGHWAIDTDHLKDLVNRHSGRLRAILCMAPNNPTGSYLTHRELELIEGLCCAHDLSLIVDEQFVDYPLYPGPSRVASVVGDNRECLTFVLSGLASVAALPQLKLAWTVACGPEELVRPALARLAAIVGSHADLNFGFGGGATPTQYALARILPTSEAMQEQIRNRVQANLQTLDAAITDSPVARLGVEAGWSAILALPQLGELDDEGWVLRMLERCDVWAEPGSAYGLDGCHLVLSLLTPPVAFAEGISRIVGLVSRIAGGGRW